MFEIRLRILDARERETDPPSYLGIVEGFPEILVHGDTLAEVEADLVCGLAEYLDRLRRSEETRIQLHDLPTIRQVNLLIARRLA